MTDFSLVRVRFRVSYVFIGALVIASFVGGDVGALADRVIGILSVYGVGRDAGLI